jgi:hypothetical protein
LLASCHGACPRSAVAPSSRSMHSEPAHESAAGSCCTHFAYPPATGLPLLTRRSAYGPLTCECHAAIDAARATGIASTLAGGQPLAHGTCECSCQEASETAKRCREASSAAVSATAVQPCSWETANLFPHNRRHRHLHHLPMMPNLPTPQCLCRMRKDLVPGAGSPRSERARRTLLWRGRGQNARGRVVRRIAA